MRRLGASWTVGEATPTPLHGMPKAPHEEQGISLSHLIYCTVSKKFKTLRCNPELYLAGSTIITLIEVSCLNAGHGIEGRQTARARKELRAAEAALSTITIQTP